MVSSVIINFDLTLSPWLETQRAVTCCIIRSILHYSMLTHSMLVNSGNTTIANDAWLQFHWGKNLFYIQMSHLEALNKLLYEILDSWRDRSYLKLLICGSRHLGSYNDTTEGDTKLCLAFKDRRWRSVCVWLLFLGSLGQRELRSKP